MEHHGGCGPQSPGPHRERPHPQPRPRPPAPRQTAHRDVLRPLRAAARRGRGGGASLQLVPAQVGVRGLELRQRPREPGGGLEQLRGLGRAGRGLGGAGVAVTRGRDQNILGDPGTGDRHIMTAIIAMHFKFYFENYAYQLVNFRVSSYVAINIQFKILSIIR